jgi:CubicO group peptidase (beta-lactamase class C family)
VQGFILEKPIEKTTPTDLRDILFDKKIELFMRLSKFPSLSACIIDGDKVIWSKGYGFYDLENKKPATEHTISM